MLSPGVNLLSEMHINQHMFSVCHTQTSPDDTFLRNIIVHAVVPPRECYKTFILSHSEQLQQYRS